MRSEALTVSASPFFMQRSTRHSFENIRQNLPTCVIIKGQYSLLTEFLNNQHN